MGKTGSAAEIRREQQEALVRSALEKRQRGETLLAKELAALERWEREQDERRGGRYVRALPKKTYATWSGRQQKVLNEQAERYGLPIGGAEINLVDVVRWLHDFLAAHKYTLGELLAPGADAPQSIEGKIKQEELEKLKHQNMKLQIDLAKSAGALLPRDQVHQALIEAAQLIRGAGERLYKKFGQEAGDLVAHAVDDMQHIIDQLAQQSHESDPEQQPVDADVSR